MILVVGGTGFVGDHLIKRLRKDDLPVRAVVRTPAEAAAFKELGVEVVSGDIADPPSLEAAAAGVERIVHLVGIIQEAPGITFQGVHVDGTRNLLNAAKKGGARHFFYQSALGTRPNAESRYHRTKWDAEELVRASGIPYTVLRPSLIYGSGDLFTLRISKMIRRWQVLPIIGSGKSKVQPLFIEDEIECIRKIVTSDSYLNETYEIGGPGQLTYEEITRGIAEAMGVRRPMVHLPLFFMKPLARVMEAVLRKPPITTDQLVVLQEDNICGMRAIREVFGIEPVQFREGLRRFIGK